MTTKKRLCTIKGITEAKVDKIKVQIKISTTVKILFSNCRKLQQSYWYVCLCLTVNVNAFLTGCRILDCS